jgi:hypothetical protein
MKPRRRTFLLAFLVIVICGAGQESIACTCITRTACEAFNRAKAVFIGRAIHATQKREDVYDGKTYVSYFGDVTFEVIEPFSEVTGRLMSVWATGDGMCVGMSFNLGSTYLVYADEGSDKKLWAHGCSRTRNLRPILVSTSDDLWFQEYQRNLEKEYNDELEFLRIVARRSLSGGRIFGEVSSRLTILGKDDRRWSAPLAGVTIKIETERQLFEVITNSDGKFDIQGLEPGSYKVTALPPESYTPSYPGNSIRGFEFSLRDCGCEKVNFFFDPSSEVIGQVLDSEGNPIAGAVVNLISADWRESEIKDGTIKSFQTKDGKSDSKGRYKIVRLTPGRYLLGVNVTRPDPKSPYPRTFYPNGSDIKDAEIITVELGQTAGPFDIRLSRKLETHTIQGMVVWSDDTPAVGARVVLRHPDELFNEVDSLRTDNQGRFTVKGLRDYKYEIIAYWYEDEQASGKGKKSPFGWKSAKSEIEQLTLTGEIKSLKIPLLKQGH